jgi:hypothetical protein
LKAYIAISCKVGCFNKVLDELLGKGLTKKEVFLLFGPIDILVQLSGISGIDEFVKEWFNPIRKITPTEVMIKRTETFVVLNEGKAFSEEPYAFLFLSCEPRELETVQQKLQATPQVLSADIVFGSYDIICPVKAGNKTELQRLVGKIEEIPGIQDTVTEIVASIY